MDRLTGVVLLGLYAPLVLHDLHGHDYGDGHARIHYLAMSVAILLERTASATYLL